MKRNLWDQKYIYIEYNKVFDNIAWLSKEMKTEQEPNKSQRIAITTTSTNELFLRLIRISRYNPVKALSQEAQHSLTKLVVDIARNIRYNNRTILRNQVQAYLNYIINGL